MQGKALMARRRGAGSSKNYASSVMLLDNTKLKHWQLEKNFAEMFEFKRDYAKWISLKLEDENYPYSWEPR